MAEQPTVELNPRTGQILINGMDMGQVADVKVHEADLGDDLLRVSITLLPSKLTVIDGSFRRKHRRCQLGRVDAARSPAAPTRQASAASTTACATAATTAPPQPR